RGRKGFTDLPNPEVAVRIVEEADRGVRAATQDKRIADGSSHMACSQEVMRGNGSAQKHPPGSLEVPPGSSQLARGGGGISTRITRVHENDRANRGLIEN